MKAEKLSTSDIISMGSYGKLVVELPDYAAVETAKNLVTRAKVRHPRKDGLTYTTSVDKSTNTITIEVVDPENVNRRNK